MGISLFILLFICHSKRLQIWICVDQLLNAILWGWADETLSARAWRCRFKKRRWAITVKILNALVFWQANHCEASYESERIRRHMAPEYRGE